MVGIVTKQRSEGGGMLRSRQCRGGRSMLLEENPRLREYC